MKSRSSDRSRLHRLCAGLQISRIFWACTIRSTCSRFATNIFGYPNWRLQSIWWSSRIFGYFTTCSVCCCTAKVWQGKPCSLFYIFECSWDWLFFQGQYSANASITPIVFSDLLFLRFQDEGLQEHSFSSAICFMQLNLKLTQHHRSDGWWQKFVLDRLSFEQRNFCMLQRSQQILKGNGCRGFVRFKITSSLI